MSHQFKKRLSLGRHGAAWLKSIHSHLCQRKCAKSGVWRELLVEMLPVILLGFSLI